MTKVKVLDVDGQVISDTERYLYPEVSEVYQKDETTYKVYHVVHVFGSNHQIIVLAWNPKPFDDDSVEKSEELLKSVYNGDFSIDTKTSSKDGEWAYLYNNNQAIHKCKTQVRPRADAGSVEGAIIEGEPYECYSTYVMSHNDEEGYVVNLNDFGGYLNESRLLTDARRTIIGQSKKASESLLQNDPKEWERLQKESDIF